MVTPNYTPANITSHLNALTSSDPDLRYMALNDINHILSVSTHAILTSDMTAAQRTSEGLINALKDKNGDVLNMAIKCLGPFANKVNEMTLSSTIDRISNLTIDKDLDQATPSIALIKIVTSLPRTGRTTEASAALKAVKTALIPRLVGPGISARTEIKASKGMLEADIEAGTDTNVIDLVTETARCFGSVMDQREVQALSSLSIRVLEQDHVSTVLQKKAVIALAVLAPHFSDNFLTSFVAHLVDLMRNSNLSPGKRKLYFNLLSSLARSIPRKLGPHLQTLAPPVFAALSQEEIDKDIATLEEIEEYPYESDEVRETALLALESFLQSCSQYMVPYSNDSIAVVLRFLRYDSLHGPDEVDDDMDDGEDELQDFDDEDFEAEAAADDDEDATYKVRRGAARAATILISTRYNELLADRSLLDRIAPALISRLKEREESVKVEILGALTLMTRLVGGGTAAGGLRFTLTTRPKPAGSMGPPASRKRRRAGSDASMHDASYRSLNSDLLPIMEANQPPANVAPALISLGSQLVRGSTDVLKSNSTGSKQAAISLIEALTLALRQEFTPYLSQVIDPVLSAMKSSSATSSSSVSENSIRVEALQLLKAIADSTSSTDLEQYSARIIPALTTAIKDRNTKVAVLALQALETYIRAFTPPRNLASDKNAQAIGDINQAVINCIGANDADFEVKRAAVHVEGLLLGFTAGTNLLPIQDRHNGLQVLSARLKNELTRMSSAKAIEMVALLVRDGSVYPPSWVDTVALELAAQLRKNSRELRGSSLSALKTLALNPASSQHISAKAMTDLLPLILPTLTNQDLHMIGPTLLILASFVRINAKLVVNKDFITAFGDMMTNPITGSTLDALLSLLQAIGENGAGKEVMTAVLRDISLKASPDLVGKVIGNLLVSGGPSVGVKLDDFVKEASASSDEVRKCLALAVMGEAGLRLGTSSPLKPDHFTQHFKTRSDRVPVSAAVALGTAGAGNIPVYLPYILDYISKGTASDYLLLHSIREILRYEGAEAEIVPYAQSLWTNLIKAAQAEDNRAIGAECLGRLAVVDPKVYLPQLQTFLTDKSPATRGMVISALRVTFAEPSTDIGTDGFDDHLRPLIVTMIKTMLNETDLENLRLALTTFNSATQHKPDLVLPHLNDVLPQLMGQTRVKPDLIREVQMGPFKHRVDDGLEIRKTAYESLYILLDLAAGLLDIPALFDRVVDGISDDHEIRVLCIMMLEKLADIAPAETRLRLDSMTSPFKTVLGNKAKENAVKQELERMEIDNRDVIRISAFLAKKFPDETSGAVPAGVSAINGRSSREWSEYWDYLRKDFAMLLRMVEDASRER